MSSDAQHQPDTNQPVTNQLLDTGTDPHTPDLQATPLPSTGPDPRIVQAYLKMLPQVEEDEETPPSISTRWSWLGATTTGSGHLKRNDENQDAFATRLLSSSDGIDTLVLAVADGAGSAAYAGEAATLCVDAFLDLIHERVQEGQTPATIDPHEVFAALQDALELAAEDRPLREYACTFTAAVLGPHDSLLMAIGDGFLVIGTAGDPGTPPRLELAFQPQQGEYVNQTLFVSTAAASDLQFRRVPTPEVTVLSSDGLYRLATDLKTNTPFTAFYPPFIAAATNPGVYDEVNDRLATFLASDAVSQRTDDDVTLVLARRL